MQIFFDTTAFYTDPFQKNKHIQLLLKLAKSGKVKLLLSKIVLEELKSNRDCRKSLKESNKAIIELNRYLPTAKKLKTYQFDFKQEIEDFFSKLIEEKVYEIVPIEDSILPNIIESYLKKKKPFAENKDSFKDAVIWFSYVSYIKKNGGESVFISNNTKDWAAKDTKDLLTLHTDLISDTDTPSYYKNIEDFLSQNKSIKNIIEDTTKIEELQLWSNKNINEAFINTVLEENIDNIQNTIYRKCQDFDSSQFGDWTNSGYVENSSSIDIISSTIEEIAIYIDEIYIAGTFTVDTLIDVFGYNACRDAEEDTHFHIDSGEISITLNYNFSLNNNKEPYGLELEIIDYQTNLKQYQYEI